MSVLTRALTSREKTDLVNALVHVSHPMVVEFVKRERAGSSASMNGAVDYLEWSVVERFLDLLSEMDQTLAENPKTLSNPQS